MRDKKKHIDFDSIIKTNPNVNVSELADNLKMLDEMQKNGVQIGPHYDLRSPYATPVPHKNSKSTGSILHAGLSKKR